MSRLRLLVRSLRLCRPGQNQGMDRPFEVALHLPRAGNFLLQRIFESKVI
jgi:hypothetical protein